jgi:transposase
LIPAVRRRREVSAGGWGLTAEQREFREQVRLSAIDFFETDTDNKAVAKTLRVSVRSIERSHAAWEADGEQGLYSKGPASVPKLSPAQFQVLEDELRKGPAAHDWADQRWTLARIKTVIGRRFHKSYTIRSVWGLMRRNGWSWQTPAPRAVERDEAAIELWKKEVWPVVERRPRLQGRGSSSRTSPGAS